MSLRSITATLAAAVALVLVAASPAAATGWNARWARRNGSATNVHAEVGSQRSTGVVPVWSRMYVWLWGLVQRWRPGSSIV